MAEVLRQAKNRILCMLIDEKELSVLTSESSRGYFKEIVQSYYSQNYRAAVVMLYSFLIYDLLMKLKVMANEGDEEADNKLQEIEKAILNGTQYSKVETKVLEFFKKKCPLYFDNFKDDIELLTKYRHKCAHLYLANDNLFQPKDYQVRMLICSMFDNVFSVRAPFIRNLYPTVQTDIERYDNELFWFNPLDEINKKVVEELKNKYFTRLTKDSLKISYITFLDELFYKDEDKNVKGIFIFVYSMTNYLVKEKTEDLHDGDITQKIQNIDINLIRTNEIRRNCLINLFSHFPKIIDIIKIKIELFQCLVDTVLIKPEFFYMYDTFFSRREDVSAYEFFKNHKGLHKTYYIQKLYDVVKDCNDFNLKNFLEIMLDAVPKIDGFNSADSFSDFFIKYLPKLSVDDAKSILDKYLNHNQCNNSCRKQFATDLGKLKQWGGQFIQ